MTERDKGCWSHNTAVGYADAMNRWLHHVREVARYLEGNQVAPAEKEWQNAISARSEANVWFNQSNNEFWRVQALVAELKTRRDGGSVTYPNGNDPIGDGWKGPNVK